MLYGKLRHNTLDQDYYKSINYIKMLAPMILDDLDLDPRTHKDNKVKPVEESCTFKLGDKERQVSQIGDHLNVGVSPSGQSISYCICILILVRHVNYFVISFIA